jgi:NodT family efflux transporter outer membrane factor (OMF) lipoprotein
MMRAAARTNVLRMCAVCLGLLAGCAVGPDFTRPPAPVVGAYTSSPSPETLAPGPGEPNQRLVVGQEISAEWWELFRSPELTATIDQALAGNQTLAAARATLAQAQEGLAQARAAFYPQVTATGRAERQKTGASGVGGGSPVNVFSLGPTVSYAPDVFGGTRRQVEEAAALAESQDRQLAAAYLTLTGNVASQAIGIAGTRLEIAAVQEIIADDERNLDLVRAKFDAGKAAQTDVLTAEATLMNDRVLLPPLLQQVSIARDALSVLLGRFPAEWTPPDFDLARITLPGELPVTLPSDLVHQRPDILEAEANLHAASAAIGVATAQMYPSIVLSASAGLEAVMTSGLSEGVKEMWSLASAVSAPIFEGGALVAQRRGAVDAYRSSLAVYRQTVLEAFGQVADTLQALAHDAELVAAARRALDVADASLALQRESYEAGKSNVLLLLDSQRLDQQARLAYARAETERYEDTSQLFVAMGGRWWLAPTDCESQPRANGCTSG